MRLVILNEFFYPDRFGGTGKVLSDLARRLQDEQDVQVTAIATQRPYRGEELALGSEDNWDGIEIHRIAIDHGDRQDLGKRLRSDIDFMWKSFKTIRKLRPVDGILVSTNPPVLPMAAWMAKKLFGIPYWYVIYDLEPDRAAVLSVVDGDSFKAKLLRNWQRRWLHGADRVIAIGRCIREHLATYYDLKDSQLSVIPVGEDSETVPALPKTGEFRKEFEGKLVLLYTGNFGRYHDFEHVFSAAEELKSDDRFAFVFVGGGKKEQELRQELELRGLSNVYLRPFASPEDYPHLLAAADLCLVTLEPGMEGLCVPSKFYSFLAAGRPTLALMGSECEVARVIEEEQCGFVLDQPSGSEIAKLLRDCADGRHDLEEMGCRARKSLERSWSSSRIAENYKKIMTKEAA